MPYIRSGDMADGSAKASRPSRMRGRDRLSRSEDGVERVREWQFALPVVIVRAALIVGFLYPLMAVFSRRRTYGQEVLRSVEGPVIFAANHLSVADNPAVLLALPWRWRMRVATAASEEVMRGRGRVQSFFAALISNGFQFSQRGSVRASLDHCARISDAGWSLLFFPEGVRSDDGAIGPFKPGIGLLAARLGVPVVPVYLKGTDSVVAKGGARPHRGYIEVRFGRPIQIPAGMKYDIATEVIRNAVASLSLDAIS